MAIRQLDTSRVSLKADELALKFKNRIIGQPKAFEALTRVLEKYQSGIYDRRRPIASLLFLGPTGVGKTGSVEAFVEGLFGKPTYMLKVDCAEYQHSHEIAKLVGSPPGYLGHRETHPFFTNKAIREKFCKYDTAGVEVGQVNPAFTVVLFDEIEKGNDALWNLMLGILDKGELTTGTNEVVDFTPTVIILTSNVGSTELAAKAGEGGIGFATPASTINDDEMKEIAMSAARRKFSPEFLNRLDDVVMFSTLTPANLVDILRIELDKLRTQIVLTSRTVFDIEVSPAAKSKLLAEGYDKRYNARELRRVVERRVAQPLGRLVTTAQIMDNDVVIVDYDGEWKYFAKGTIRPRVSEPSVQSGRVEVPTLRIPPGSTPPSSDIPKSGGWPLLDQLNNPVLEVPRRNPQPLFERRGYKRHLQ